ncbi:MAG: response regulator transcription factor [Holophagaceae bacterium]|jgi:DNA-binding response OmpR family regulator|nr:response regulator transcription factor [Holophagaceae bacterium]
MNDISGITVLVVEDDSTTRHYAINCLEKAGFEVTGVATGEEGLSIAKATRPDVVVLDIMLPGINGFEFCTKLHEAEIDSIIIMLTVKTEDIDKIHGLEIGADDYMAKPYNPDELIARIKAILRRWLPTHRSDDILEYKGVRIDYKHLLAYKDRRELDLTKREITLLSVFLRNQGRLLSREELYKSIYGENHFGTQKVIDVYVKRLRVKIEDDSHSPSVIKTVWGKGYVCGEYEE